MILHAKHRSQANRRVILQLPDTDVLFRSLDCPELWFRTGVKDWHRLIPVHDIAHALGEKMCSSLPGFHAITGCDSTSSLAGIGKKKAWDGLCRSCDHQDSLFQFSERNKNLT